MWICGNGYASIYNNVKDRKDEKQEDSVRQPERRRGKVDALHALRQLPRMEEDGRMRDRHRPAEDDKDAAKEGSRDLRRPGGTV